MNAYQIRWLGYRNTLSRTVSAAIERAIAYGEDQVVERMYKGRLSYVVAVASANTGTVSPYGATRREERICVDAAKAHNVEVAL